MRPDIKPIGLIPDRWKDILTKLRGAELDCVGGRNIVYTEKTYNRSDSCRSRMLSSSRNAPWSRFLNFLWSNIWIAIMDDCRTLLNIVSGRANEEN